MVRAADGTPEEGGVACGADALAALPAAPTPSGNPTLAALPEARFVPTG